MLTEEKIEEGEVTLPEILKAICDHMQALEDRIEDLEAAQDKEPSRILTF